jgi:hypothetical protein
MSLSDPHMIKSLRRGVDSQNTAWLVDDIGELAKHRRFRAFGVQVNHNFRLGR